MGGPICLDIFLGPIGPQQGPNRAWREGDNEGAESDIWEVFGDKYKDISS